MAKSKDLFDETTMTFGEHLEVLRSHLLKAVLGLVLALVLTLTFGNYLVAMIRAPIDEALRRNSIFAQEDDVSGFDFWSYISVWFHKAPEDSAPEETKPGSMTRAERATVIVNIKPSDLRRLLHEADPAHFVNAGPVESKAGESKAGESKTGELEASEEEKPLSLALSAKEFRDFRETTEESHRAITLNVQEAFTTYIKVAFVSAFILASPWIFYQLWLFVAAGLYPHERKYIYIYLPLSIGLFLFGVFFCFFLAMPLILDFLLSYNRWLGVVAEIRLSEWVPFVILLPLMFGLTFQLPMLMVFLERIGIFDANDYRSRRRLAILVMAVAAMLLSPGGDVGTMTLLFVPLVILYEFGIILCGFWKAERPFGEPAVS